MKSKLAFLLYDSRSGSTFFASKLEKLQDCYVTNESDFVSRILFNKDNINDNLIDFLFKDIRFVDMNIERESLNDFITLNKPDAKKLIEYILIEHLKRRYSFFEDKPNNIIVIKHPPIGDFNTIKEIWNNVRYFLIVRDGRDVHLSKYNSINLYNKRFSSNVLSSALNWKVKQALFVQHVAPNDIFRYEELIEQVDIFKFIANKMEVPSLLDERKEFPLPESQKGFHSNIKKGVLSSNKKKYAENSYVNFVFVLIAGKVLRKVGYTTNNKLNVFYLFQFIYEFITLMFGAIFNTTKYLFTDFYSFKTKVSKILGR